MFALQPAPTMGTVVAPWSGSMIDRLSSLEDMPPKGKNLRLFFLFNLFFHFMLNYLGFCS